MLTKVVVLLALVRFSTPLSEVDTECVKNKLKPLDNSSFLGKWYVLIEFNPSFSFHYCYCPTLEFTKPSAEEIAKYREKYDNETLPYRFNDNPVIVKGDNILTDGAVFGKTEAKFYVLSPKSVLRQPEGYTAQIYKKINNNYFLYYDCRLRKNFMKLVSRRKDPSEEELDRIVASVEEVKYLHKLRMCRNHFCYQRH